MSEHQRSADALASESRVQVAASLRDASWHDRPNVRSPKQYHVVIAEGIAACDQRQRRLILTDWDERPATEVHPDMRCRRPGCRARWPEFIARGETP